jgi:hypothetical protein
MRFRVIRSTPAGAAGQLPPDLALRLLDAGLPAEARTFVVFRLKDRPIRESLVSRAINALEPGEKFVAIGDEFAADAVRRLSGHVEEIISRRSEFWTGGAEFDRTRTMIATNVKGPELR